MALHLMVEAQCVKMKAEVEADATDFQKFVVKAKAEAKSQYVEVEAAVEMEEELNASSISAYISCMLRREFYHSKIDSSYHTVRG